MSETSEVLVVKTRQALHQAIQDHMVAMHGAVITTDWIVVSENVDDSNERILYSALSEGIPSWKVRGISYVGLKYVHDLTN